MLQVIAYEAQRLSVISLNFDTKMVRMLVEKQQSTRRSRQRLPSCHVRPSAVACTLNSHYITYQDRTTALLLACLPAHTRSLRASPRHWPCAGCNRPDAAVRRRRTSVNNATRRLDVIICIVITSQSHLRVIHCAGQSTALHVSRSIGRSCFCDMQSLSGSTSVRVVVSPGFVLKSQQYVCFE